MFLKNNLYALAICALFSIASSAQCNPFDWISTFIWGNQIELKEAEVNKANQEFNQLQFSYIQSDMETFKKAHEFNNTLLEACKKGDTKICNMLAILEYKRPVAESKDAQQIRHQMRAKLKEIVTLQSQLNALKNQRNNILLAPSDTKSNIKELIPPFVPSI